MISRFALILLSLSALNLNEVMAQKDLVRLGKTRITDSEFEYLFRKNHQNRPADFTKAGVDAYLELFVNFKLKVIEAGKSGMDTTRAFRTEFEGYRKDIRKSFEPAVANAEQLLAEAYERLKSEVHAAHILLKADPDTSDTLVVYNRCLEIRRRILAGEDFAMLARQFSEDPSARQNSGDLGYFTALNMVYPFENAAYRTPIGQVSMPVRTRFGYHLVKVLDVRPAGEETEVSHILIRHGEHIRTEPQAREMIFQVADRLQAGLSWDEACREYSEDPSNKDKGGRLPSFRRGHFSATAPEFEEAALALQKPGEWSDPVSSPFGWHILRFERKAPMRSLQEMRMVLQQQVSRDERSRYSGVKRLEKLKLMLEFKENTPVVQEVFALADSTILGSNWRYRGPLEFRKQVLFQLAGKDRLAGNFFDFLSRQSISAVGADPALIMRRFYSLFVQQEVDRASDEKLEQENVGYRNLLQEYREGMMLFNIMEKVVWNRAAEDTVGQRKHYISHQAKYQAGDRVYACLYGSGDLKFMRAIYPKLVRGDTLTSAEMKKFRTVSTYRNFERGDSKVTDRVPWQTGWHETEVDKILYFVHVKSLVPPGQKSFEEARSTVIADYQDVLEAEWMRKLRRKYPVRVDKQVLAEATARMVNGSKPE